jgi:hypothetical protein
VSGKFVLQASIYDCSESEAEPEEVIEGEEIGEFATLEEAVERLNELMQEGGR